jgi:hypothetical protein
LAIASGSEIDLLLKHSEKHPIYQIICDHLAWDAKQRKNLYMRIVRNVGGLKDALMKQSQSL